MPSQIRNGLNAREGILFIELLLRPRSGRQITRCLNAREGILFIEPITTPTRTTRKATS